MWAFCLNSLFREYGWLFFRRMALPHPVKTAKAFLASGAIDPSPGVIDVPAAGRGEGLEGGRSVVGVGFCLKPMDPPCPSGRANHDCMYLENLAGAEAPDAHLACRECTIREIGTEALRSGAAFYVMTSAKDILLDVFAPALDERRFSAGVFVLCRYSLRPFSVGLLASGMRGRLFTFESGDCRDYRTWLQADRGIKDEQTAIADGDRELLMGLLGGAAAGPTPGARFVREGNIFYAEEPAGTTESRCRGGAAR